MKSSKTKLIIVAAALFLPASTQNLQADFFNNTQIENETSENPYESDNSNSGFFSSESSGSRFRAAPPGGGDAQKLPISDGILILTGLAVCYKLVKQKCTSLFKEK